MPAEFVPFGKIARLKRGCVVTEKLDGTNACVVVEGAEITVQSRNRIITPESDNYGYAAPCGKRILPRHSEFQNRCLSSWRLGTRCRA